MVEIPMSIAHRDFDLSLLLFFVLCSLFFILYPLSFPQGNRIKI